MATDPFSANPLFNAWVKAQTELFAAQEPFWRQMTGAMPGSAHEDMTAAAEGHWEQARRQSLDWIGKFAKQASFPASGEGIAQETLQRMMDPGQFLYAGSDEINQTIQKLVEGPEFADIGTLERQGLKATQEWLALREASTEYRMVTVKAWSRAFGRFTKRMMSDPDLWKSGQRAVTNCWLDIANDELISTQRTEAFLNAQRKLLRAGVDYRLRERELVELWCETHSIPTRTEVDDLHEMVHNLRRELRDLRKSVAAGQKTPARKAPARKPSSPKKAEGQNG